MAMKRINRAWRLERLGPVRDSCFLDYEFFGRSTVMPLVEIGKLTEAVRIVQSGRHRREDDESHVCHALGL